MGRLLAGVFSGSICWMVALAAAAQPPVRVADLAPPLSEAPVQDAVALVAPKTAPRTMTPAEDVGEVETVKSGDGIWEGCDGYGGPTLSGDGMTRWGLGQGEVVGGGAATRTTPALGGESNIADCGAALDELRTRFPEYWLRRVSLVRARAMHRLAMGDTAGALRDLDAAEAEAGVHKDDLLYRRSLALGIDLLRAYAAKLSGDPARAERLALQAWSARPWNRETARAALIILGPEGSERAILTVLRSDTQFDPAATGKLFDFTFEHGHFAEALDLYDGLTPPILLSQGARDDRSVAMLEQENRNLAAMFWAVEDGRRAYALAVLGRKDEARATLKAAAERLAAATPPARPVAADATTLEKMINAVWEQGNRAIRTNVPPALEAWRTLVQARLDLADGKTESTLSLLNAPSVPRSWAYAELLETWSNLDATRKPAALRVREALLSGRRSTRETDIKALFETLPEAETPGRVVGDHGRGILSGPNGFSVVAHPDRGMTTVGYRGVWSSLTLMEEEALLKAAKLAREKGKGGLIVLARRDIRHSTTLYRDGRAVRTDPMGYETQLDVVFVDPPNPPAPFDKARWRIIDARTVEAALAPVYPDFGAPAAK